MPFTIKFHNNKTFEKEFDHFFYYCDSYIFIYNSIFTKIMSDYQNRHWYDEDDLHGTIFVNANNWNETLAFKFNFSFEQNKDGEDICTVEYLGCFLIVKEHLVRVDAEEFKV